MKPLGRVAFGRKATNVIPLTVRMRELKAPSAVDLNRLSIDRYQNFACRVFNQIYSTPELECVKANSPGHRESPRPLIRKMVTTGYYPDPCCSAIKSA